MKKISLIFGGNLGNQMFQYAFYKKLQNLGYLVDADLWIYKYIPTTFIMKDIFKNINIKYKKSFDTTKYNKHCKYRIFLHRLLPIFTSRFKYIRLECGFGFSFNETLYDEIAKGKNEKYQIQGNFQNSLWFKGVEESVCRDFTFPELTGKENLKFFDEIKSCEESVAIHVRSYASESGKIDDMWDLPEKYYKDAIEEANKKFDNPKFFVFSNDIKYCQTKLLKDYSNMVFVDCNGSNQKAYRDMQLMSYCKSAIISNSTFAWWGAYLNPFEYKKTIFCPKNWYVHIPPYLGKGLKDILFRYKKIDTNSGSSNIKDWIEIDS